MEQKGFRAYLKGLRLWAATPKCWQMKSKFVLAKASCREILLLFLVSSQSLWKTPFSHVTSSHKLYIKRFSFSTRIIDPENMADFSYFRCLSPGVPSCFSTPDFQPQVQKVRFKDNTSRVLITKIPTFKQLNHASF
ncbi:Hypothetical predicted protein [Podarcis lilfordi]|uniref:Uncharacterized protein n=1 Tax=Podarcis lilfordi TaxID=74358 RepID=A0AA35KUW1_9SAUR|nr:Hypothetical predicted protein [Podarcis lilfordi]